MTAETAGKYSYGRRTSANHYRVRRRADWLARRIAQAIISNRPLSTTEELAELIESQHRGKWKKIHPATRTFQALRIAVNDELGQVEGLLPLLPDLLKQGGRVGIISFHSLEDRLVKQYFTEQMPDMKPNSKS